MIRLAVLAVASPSNGGVFQYTLSMLQALAAAPEFRITIYTGSSNHHYDEIGLRTRYVSLSRLDLATLAGTAILGFRLPDPFADEEIVLAPTYSPLLLHTRRPFAFTLHDLQERYLPQYFSRLQRTWRGFLQRRLCRDASRIICESPFVHGDIVRFFGVDAAKVLVLPSPPVLATATRPASHVIDAAISKFALPDRFIFYPAQFWAHKNHVRLVEAFARLAGQFPDVQLLFTGGRNGEFHRVLARVQSLGMADRVRHLGYVEPEEMAVLYARSLGLVMPSLFESVSIPVYEAQQAGTPVCASGVLAIADQVADSGLLFDPLSVDSIRASLESLLGDPELRSRIGHAGRVRFESMRWGEFGNRLREVAFGLAASETSRGSAAGKSRSGPETLEADARSRLPGD